MLLNSQNFILAVDVHYTESAVAVGALFDAWQSAEPAHVISKHIEGVAPYESGSFYKRELPCIFAVLDAIQAWRANIVLQAIVIDGYVHLGQDHKPGLGAHLYEAMPVKVPVIGVAKTEFAGASANSHLLRGTSEKPLFITAIGVELELAKQHIASMHGEHRLPTLLKLVDRLCRAG